MSMRTMPIQKLVLCLLVLVLGGGAAAAAPGDPIGSAVTIVNLVTAKLDNNQHNLASGDDIHQQELIEADKDGRGELVLRDDTRLAIGPGARLLLDRFVYDKDISGGAIVLELARGAFRFITGVAVKPAYVIRTPTASITVRGTVFDVYVQDTGAAWLLLIEGAVEICTANGKCVVDDEVGKLVLIGPDRVDKPTRWADLPERKDISFDSAFPFIVTAPEIDNTPRLTRDDVVLGTDKPPRHKTDDGGKNNDDEDTPQRRKKAYPKKQREVEYKRPKRSTDDEGRDSNGIPFSIGVGIGGGFGGGRHGGGGGYPGGGGGGKGR